MRRAACHSTPSPRHGLPWSWRTRAQSACKASPESILLRRGTRSMRPGTGMKSKCERTREQARRRDLTCRKHTRAVQTKIALSGNLREADACPFMQRGFSSSSIALLQYQALMESILLLPDFPGVLSNLVPLQHHSRALFSSPSTSRLPVGVSRKRNQCLIWNAASP